jgi:MFS family permease
LTFATVRLTLRLHAVTLTGVGLVFGTLVALALWYAARLEGHPEATACFTQATEMCEPYFDVHEQASRVMFAFALVPVVSGLLLGVPIVAQELERSTTQLSWSLEPSRWRWLIQRALPIVALAIFVGSLAGIAADSLEAGLFPFADAGASFRDFGMRGPMLAARLVLALGVGIFIGAVVGRTLTSLLLALLVTAAVILALGSVNERIQAPAAVPIRNDLIDHAFAGREVDFKYKLQTGELLTWEQLQARFADPIVLDHELESAEQLVYVLPQEQYGSVSGLEAAATVLVAAAFIVATVPIVNRRHAGPGRMTVGPLGRALGGRRRRASDLSRLGLARRIRLVLWPHRLELLAGAAAALGASVACALVVIGLLSTSPPASCLVDLANPPVTPECATVDEFLSMASEWGNMLFASMAVLPWLVGTLIGAVIVGREIELGTAPFAWSLQPDRRRWLLLRIVVAAGLVALLLVVPSALSTEMQRVARPWVSPDLTLDNYALRGPLVVVRGLAAALIGVFAGAVLGRVLPAVILAGVLSLGLALSLQVLWPFGQPNEPPTNPPDGIVVPGNRPSIPGERLHEVELREGVLLAGTSLALVAVSLAVVERRRPY